MALPTPPVGPWTSGRSPRHSLHPMPLSMFEALEAGDLERASSHAPAFLLPLPSFLISTANRGIWRRRLDMAAADPDQKLWISRLVVYEAERDLEEQSPDQETRKTNPAVIVGRIGFHGKPDKHGMVEVGYEIDPAQRRRGHAKAAVQVIVDVARSIEGVNMLRASVVETNWISRRVIEGQGMKKIGDEKHPRRGLKDVFVLDVSN